MMNALQRGPIARPPTGLATTAAPARANLEPRCAITPSMPRRPFIVLPLVLGPPTMILRILSAACLGLTSVLVAVSATDSWRWKLALAGIAAICWADGLRVWLKSQRFGQRPWLDANRRRVAVWTALATSVATITVCWATSSAARRSPLDDGKDFKRAGHASSLSLRQRIMPVANHGHRSGAVATVDKPAEDISEAYGVEPAAAPRPFAAPEAKRLSPTFGAPRRSGTRAYPAANALGTDSDSAGRGSVRHATPSLPALDERLDMAAEQRRLEEFMQVAYQSDESQGEGKPTKPTRPTPPATTDAQTGAGGTAAPMGTSPMGSAPMGPAPMGTTSMTPASTGSASGSGSGSAPSGSASATTLGVAPPKEQPEFLRQDSVLLEPGEYQMEFGVAYTLSNSTNTISLQQGGAVFAGDIVRTNRLIISTIDLRVGITPDWQGSVVLPFGWSSGQLVFAGTDEYSSTGGIGDINISLTRLIQEGDMDSPTIMANFSCSAPTGESNFASSIAVPGASLGQGFWTTTAGITMVRVFDPLVLFGGFGYQHRFDTEILPNVTLSPGVMAYYRFGVGYAINSKITLNGSFSGSYLSEISINDRRSAGSAREPLQLRLAMTIASREPSATRQRKARTIEPYLTIGLTDVAPDAAFGISWSY